MTLSLCTWRKFMGENTRMMGALSSRLPLRHPPPRFLQKRSLNNSPVHVARSRTSVGSVGAECYESWHRVARDARRRNGITVNALPSSFHISSQEGDAEYPSIPKNYSDDGAMAAGELIKDEDACDIRMSSLEFDKFIKEGSNKLNKDAGFQIKQTLNDRVKPLMGHSRSELSKGYEVRGPSWAVIVLTFAVAFSAGVALALCRGGLLVKNNREAMVDVRAAPSAMSAVPYPEQLFGHFRCEEAPESDLKAVLADQSVKLRTAAADAFLRMQDAARKDGIWLNPLSGHRPVDLQQEVFFNIKAERLQSAPERAKVSAPPGYSEHHTGYAIDIGDALDPDTHLNPEFDQAAAYSWLQHNAAREDIEWLQKGRKLTEKSQSHKDTRFHFEMSFPKDNIQGILYEPWHWRFVGDDHSLQTFYAQHKLYGHFTTCNP